MRNVAKPTEVTSGAKSMDMPKRMLPAVQTLRREGFERDSASMIGRRLSGGRGVKPFSVASSPGLVTSQGRTMDVANPTVECTISAVLPTRPTWERASPEAAGAWCRR
jgi:hypothetical protein